MASVGVQGYICVGSLVGAISINNMSGYKSDWSEPKKLAASFVPALKAATLGFTSDDLPCLLSLFFDNLATIVGVGFVFISTRRLPNKRAQPPVAC